jgi:alkylation response protein AidB-like acyl-CoA dehydrogenase
MTRSHTPYLETVDRIVRETVAANADRVDREAIFPQASVDALAGAGLLGLISAPEVGGAGQGPGAAVRTVECLAGACGSTAMVIAMHYAGAAVIEKYGPQDVRREIAAGRHLSTLAFSEAGSRSHFWAPVSSAARVNGGFEIDAQKSWITSAGSATAYVWSSRPIEAEGASTIWLVPRQAQGINATIPYEGLGLRGNDSRRVTANAVKLDGGKMLGKDGEGFAIMMGTVLPIFSMMNAAFSVGLMDAATRITAEHASGTRYTHLDSSLAELPTIRAYIARMRVKTVASRTLLYDTVEAVESGREDAMLRVLECKAAAGETAIEVLSTAMRVCGGAAYRKDVGVERLFRDAQAANVMAPTTDQLYDFIGKAACGLPLF